MTHSIRHMGADDITALADFSRAEGLDRTTSYFTRCIGERTVLAAFSGETMAGFVTLNPQSAYALFRRFNIPEIQDLYVGTGQRRQGLGRALLLACEDAARNRHIPEIGISVGVDARFAPALQLYLTAGYLPDGQGICYDDAPAALHALYRVDDFLTLKMRKTL